MALRFNQGFIVGNNDPIDSRIVHDGKPWTNPNIRHTGISPTAYAGLLAVDSADDSLWVLTDVSNSNLSSGWTEFISADVANDAIQYLSDFPTPAVDNDVIYLTTATTFNSVSFSPGFYRYEAAQTNWLAVTPSKTIIGEGDTLPPIDSTVSLDGELFNRTGTTDPGIYIFSVNASPTPNAWTRIANIGAGGGTTIAQADTFPLSPSDQDLFILTGNTEVITASPVRVATADLMVGQRAPIGMYRYNMTATRWESINRKVIAGNSLPNADDGGVGDLFIIANTNTALNTLHYHNGTAWIQVANNIASTAPGTPFTYKAIGDTAGNVSVPVTSAIVIDDTHQYLNRASGAQTVTDANVDTVAAVEAHFTAANNWTRFGDGAGGGGTTIAEGTAFPTTPTPASGDLFILTASIANFLRGLYRYDGTNWVSVDIQGINEVRTNFGAPYSNNSSPSGISAQVQSQDGTITFVVSSDQVNDFATGLDLAGRLPDPGGSTTIDIGSDPDIRLNIAYTAAGTQYSFNLNGQTNSISRIIVTSPEVSTDSSRFIITAGTGSFANSGLGTTMELTDIDVSLFQTSTLAADNGVLTLEAIDDSTIVGIVDGNVGIGNNGVTTLNSERGDVSITSPDNSISIHPSGSSIEIEAHGGSGTAESINGLQGAVTLNAGTDRDITTTVDTDQSNNTISVTADLNDNIEVDGVIVNATAIVPDGRVDNQAASIGQVNRINQATRNIIRAEFAELEREIENFSDPSATDTYTNPFGIVDDPLNAPNQSRELIFPWERQYEINNFNHVESFFKIRRLSTVPSAPIKQTGGSPIINTVTSPLSQYAASTITEAMRVNNLVGFDGLARFDSSDTTAGPFNVAQEYTALYPENQIDALNPGGVTVIDTANPTMGIRYEDATQMGSAVRQLVIPFTRADNNALREAILIQGLGFPDDASDLTNALLPIANIQTAQPESHSIGSFEARTRRVFLNARIADPTTLTVTINGNATTDFTTRRGGDLFDSDVIEFTTDLNVGDSVVATFDGFNPSADTRSGLGVLAWSETDDGVRTYFNSDTSIGWFSSQGFTRVTTTADSIIIYNLLEPSGTNSLFGSAIDTRVFFYRTNVDLQARGIPRALTQQWAPTEADGSTTREQYRWNEQETNLELSRDWLPNASTVFGESWNGIGAFQFNGSAGKNDTLELRAPGFGQNIADLDDVRSGRIFGESREHTDTGTVGGGNGTAATGIGGVFEFTANPVSEGEDQIIADFLPGWERGNASTFLTDAEILLLNSRSDGLHLFFRVDGVEHRVQLGIAGPGANIIDASRPRANGTDRIKFCWALHAGYTENQTSAYTSNTSDGDIRWVFRHWYAMWDRTQQRWIEDRRSLGQSSSSFTSRDALGRQFNLVQYPVTTNNSSHDNDGQNLLGTNPNYFDYGNNFGGSFLFPQRRGNLLEITNAGRAGAGLDPSFPQIDRSDLRLGITRDKAYEPSVRYGNHGGTGSNVPTNYVQFDGCISRITHFSLPNMSYLDSIQFDVYGQDGPVSFRTTGHPLNGVRTAQNHTLYYPYFLRELALSTDKYSGLATEGSTNFARIFFDLEFSAPVSIRNGSEADWEIGDSNSTREGLIGYPLVSQRTRNSYRGAETANSDLQVDTDYFNSIPVNGSALLRAPSTWDFSNPAVADGRFELNSEVPDTGASVTTQGQSITYTDGNASINHLFRNWYRGNDQGVANDNQLTETVFGDNVNLPSTGTIIISSDQDTTNAGPPSGVSNRQAAFVSRAPGGISQVNLPDPHNFGNQLLYIPALSNEVNRNFAVAFNEQLHHIRVQYPAVGSNLVLDVDYDIIGFNHSNGGLSIIPRFERSFDSFPTDADVTTGAATVILIDGQRLRLTTDQEYPVNDSGTQSTVSLEAGLYVFNAGAAFPTTIDPADVTTLPTADQVRGRYSRVDVSGREPDRDTTFTATEITTNPDIIIIRNGNYDFNRTLQADGMDLSESSVNFIGGSNISLTVSGDDNDTVTIAATGAAGGGVDTDATITGDGTSSDPLSVNISNDPGNIVNQGVDGGVFASGLGGSPARADITFSGTSTDISPAQTATAAVAGGVDISSGVGNRGLSLFNRVIGFATQDQFTSARRSSTFQLESNKILPAWDTTNDEILESEAFPFGTFTEHLFDAPDFPSTVTTLAQRAAYRHRIQGGVLFWRDTGYRGSIRPSEILVNGGLNADQYVYRVNTDGYVPGPGLSDVKSYASSAPIIEYTNVPASFGSSFWDSAIYQLATPQANQPNIYMIRYKGNTTDGSNRTARAAVTNYINLGATEANRVQNYLGGGGIVQPGLVASNPWLVIDRDSAQNITLPESGDWMVVRLYDGFTTGSEITGNQRRSLGPVYDAAVPATHVVAGSRINAGPTGRHNTIFESTFNFQPNTAPPTLNQNLSTLGMQISSFNSTNIVEGGVNFLGPDNQGVLFNTAPFNTFAIPLPNVDNPTYNYAVVNSNDERLNFSSGGNNTYEDYEPADNTTVQAVRDEIARRIVAQANARTARNFETWSYVAGSNNIVIAIDRDNDFETLYEADADPIYTVSIGRGLAGAAFAITAVVPDLSPNVAPDILRLTYRRFNPDGATLAPQQSFDIDIPGALTGAALDSFLAERAREQTANLIFSLNDGVLSVQSINNELHPVNWLSASTLAGRTGGTVGARVSDLDITDRGDSPVAITSRRPTVQVLERLRVDQVTNADGQTATIDRLVGWDLEAPAGAGFNRLFGYNTGDIVSYDDGTTVSLYTSTADQEVDTTLRNYININIQGTASTDILIFSDNESYQQFKDLIDNTENSTTTSVTLTSSDLPTTIVVATDEQPFIEYESGDIFAFDDVPLVVTITPADLSRKIAADGVDIDSADITVTRSVNSVTVPGATGANWEEVSGGGGGSNVTFGGDSTEIITNVNNNAATSFSNGTLTVSPTGGAGVTGLTVVRQMSDLPTGTDLTDGVIIGMQEEITIAGVPGTFGTTAVFDIGRQLTLNNEPGQPIDAEARFTIRTAGSTTEINRDQLITSLRNQFGNDLITGVFGIEEFSRSAFIQAGTAEIQLLGIRHAASGALGVLFARAVPGVTLPLGTNTNIATGTSGLPATTDPTIGQLLRSGTSYYRDAVEDEWRAI